MSLGYPRLRRPRPVTPFVGYCGGLSVPPSAAAVWMAIGRAAGPDGFAWTPMPIGVHTVAKQRCHRSSEQLKCRNIT
jgi:hypothetical protein